MKPATRASLLPLLGLLAAPNAMADTFDITAPISAVTLYRDGGAVVTRRATVSLPAGNHTLEIDGLTRDLDEGFGVRARFIENNSSIAQVHLREKFSDAVVSDAQAALASQIAALESENGGDRASIEAINIQLRFVEKLGSSTGDKIAATASSTDAIFDAMQKSLAFVRTNSAELISERRALETAVSKRTDRITALRRQLNQTGETRTSENQVSLNINSAGAGQTTLELSYMVNDAEWSVETEADLNSDTGEVKTRLYALVSQQSGEDWNSVPLKLSTSSPSRNISHYKPLPEYLNLQDPRNRPLPMQTRKLASEAAFDTEEIVVTGSRIRYDQTRFDAAFSIDNSTTVDADGSVERFLVEQTLTNANVILRATPRISPEAYVYADATLTEFPYLRTPSVSLTRDGTYVGNAIWPDLKPDTVLELPFGSLERVSIETVTLPSEDGDSGIFNKRMNREEKKQFRITNGNDAAVTMEIFGLLPNSMNEDLKVERLRGSTAPTETDIGGQPGVIMWRKTLAPGEAWEINHWYKVSFPENKQLVRQ